MKSIEKKTNSQATHFLSKGIQIQSLKTHNITPQEVNLPFKKEIKKISHLHTPIYINNSLIESKTTTCRILDGFALLESSGLGFPEDSRKACLTGMGYSSVVEEDLLFFIGLVYLDVSDNLFDFNSFEKLPRLKELRIVCNNIEEIGDITGYQSLRSLDISYNKLTQESVLALSMIQNLQELDLSGNNLMTLPSQLELFCNLERLALEHNKLSGNEIFLDLSRIPRLRELDLAFNMLSCIPPQSCFEGNFR